MSETATQIRAITISSVPTPVPPFQGRLKLKGGVSKKKDTTTAARRGGRRPARRAIRSWEGLEAQRDELRAAARAYFIADQELEEACRRFGGDPIGYTIAEKKRPGQHSLPEAQRAGAALNRLISLHTTLVQQHGLCFYFVRNEWAPILNPTPQEKYRCAKLVDKLNCESAEEELTELDIAPSSSSSSSSSSSYPSY